MIWLKIRDYENEEQKFFTCKNPEIFDGRALFDITVAKIYEYEGRKCI